MKTIWCVCWLVVVGCLAGCGFGGPGSAAKAFVRHASEGRIEPAVESFSSSVRGTFGDDKLKSALKIQARTAASKGGIKKVQILEEKVQGDLATVKLQVTFGDGSIDQDDFSMIREEGQWKIDVKK